MNDHNIMYIDLETTGLDPNKHSIIQLAAVYRNNWFHKKCPHDPNLEIDDNALKINGYRPDAERKGWSWVLNQTEMLKKFMFWLNELRSNDDVILCGCNVGFDYNFLNASIERYKIDADILRFRVLDVHQIAYFFNIIKNKKQMSAYSLYKDMGIEEERIPHTAISGVEKAINIFNKLANFTICSN